MLGVPTVTCSPYWELLSRRKRGLGVFEERRELTQRLQILAKPCKPQVSTSPQKASILSIKHQESPYPLLKSPSVAL